MTKLVGIVNVTPDSFSDRGKAATSEAALEQIATLVREGAAVIDIGAESTRPNALFVSPEEEWKRLEPIIKPALEIWQKRGIEFSIDTRHAPTAAKALALGVDWINDVSGGESPEIWQLMRTYPKAKYVLMHSLTVPAEPSMVLAPEADVIEELLVFFATKMVEMQLEEHQVILDPGIGFGKTAEQSLQILRRIGELNVLNLPLLVGHSRKSCFAEMTSATAADRDGATVATSIYLARNKVDYLRVHAVGLHTQALKVAEYFDV
jgi:dihydropteroate synthase